MPDSTPAIQKVAIVGPGLIGGSFGLGLRKCGFSGAIVGVGESPYIESALACGAVTRISTLEEAAELVDLLYLSGTVDNILETIDRLTPIVRPGCLVTDVGSTKRCIVDRAAAFHSALFVGGHPMAGKEKRGVENADPDLFRDRPYILTSSPDARVFREFTSWLSRMGARITTMEAGQHDATVAFSSHLPQLISTALAFTLSQHRELPVTSVFGSGLTDMTRLALSAPGLWQSILETNRDQVISAIDEYLQTLNTIRSGLASSEIFHIFERANEYAYSLRTKV